MNDKIFNRYDPEYLDNGHYFIDGVEYMSIWAFKEAFELGSTDKSINLSESDAIRNKVKEFYKCVPDDGGDPWRYIYNVEDLKIEFKIS